MTHEFDVIVAGGGPSGSACAYRLAARGRSVLLLEKSTMPREKLCGGAVSEQALQYLGFDVPQELHEAECFGARIHYRGLSVEVRSETRVAILVARSRFDAFMVEKAREKGASVRFEQVRGIEVLPDRAVARTDAAEYFARLVVIASGAASTLARLVRPKDAPARLGYCLEQVDARRRPDLFADLEGVVDVHFGVSGFGYGWVFPHGSSYSVGVGGLGSLFPDPKGAMRRFWIERGLPEQGLKPKGWPIPCGGFRRRIAAERLILAGDAAGFVDAFNGEGIAHAIRSGQLAGDVATLALSADDCTEAFLSSAVRASHGELQASMRYALWLSRLMHSCPTLFIRALASEPELLRKYLLVAQNRLSYRGFFLWLLTRLPLRSLKALAARPAKRTPPASIRLTPREERE